MSRFEDFKNRVGYILLVYLPALICLFWVGSWRVFTWVVIALIAVEVWWRLLKQSNTTSFAAQMWTGLLAVAICVGMYHTIELREAAFGLTTVLIATSAVLAADSFAYGGGKGKQAPPSRFKLANKLSPNKSDVGFVSGYAGGAVTLLLVWAISELVGDTAFGLGQAVRMALVLPFVAVFGDLIESGTKRWLGIKDLSGALGAHGGFTDRFDALGLTLLFYKYFDELLFA